MLITQACGGGSVLLPAGQPGCASPLSATSRVHTVRPFHHRLPCPPALLALDGQGSSGGAARVRPVFRLLPVAQRPPVPFDGGSTRPSACPWAPRAPSCANSACIRPAPLARKADFIAPFGTPPQEPNPILHTAALPSHHCRRDHLCSRCPFPALCPCHPFLGPLLANVPPTCNCTLQSSISI